MARTGSSFIGCLAALAMGTAGAVAVPHVVGAAVDPAAPVVVNEIYGGGGNAGATVSHDFVELYNTTDGDIDLSGWSLQYKTAVGGSWNVHPLSGVIRANDYFLIRGDGGSGLVTVPTPNLVIARNLSATNGNVALVSDATQLACAPATCAGAASVVDLVGFGTGDSFAGSAAPAGSNANSITRDADHTNTAVNGADFTTANPPTPTAGFVEPPDEFEGTIAEIQGTGFESPYVGQIATTRGVVTAAYPTGGFNGFVIQTEGTGGFADLGAHTASDALFVSGTVPASVEIGDFVEVTGTVQENFGLTRLAVAGDAGVVELAEPFEPVLPVTAPWLSTAAERETLESMLYRPQGTFTVSETFPTNQYGEVGLATGDTPLMQPSDRGRPGSPEFQAAVADNFARGVVLDDGASTNYLNAANSSLVPPFVAVDGSLRVGGTATFTDDVIVDYQFGVWRFQPRVPVTDANDQDVVTFTATRPAAPDPAALGDGAIKIATFNVLNYFTTGGVDYETANPGVDCTSYDDRTGNPVTVNRCQIPGTPPTEVNGPRGAWEAEDLARQQAKTVAAINAMDADVVGLMEMENSGNLGEPVDEATATLVAALNAAAGANVWAFVPSSGELPDQSLRDVITNAIIYKPAVVTPVGAARALGSLSDPGEAYENAREPIGQAFVHAGGGDPFFVAVNHFKSKSCDSSLPAGDPNTDQGDGQSCFNADRIEQAQALVEWVDGVLPTYDPPIADAFLIGDFNSYTYEDPMQAFYDAGYVDLNAEHGNLKQSYNFDGLNGSLDHILANPSGHARVTGSDIWNINAPESLALEYSRYNYHGALYYAPDPYRSSDHDPEVAAITAAAPPPEGTTVITLLSINDFHGRIDANTVNWAGTVGQLVAAGGADSTAITGAGDLVGASVFASAVQQDQPTIDVMNAIGLDASAVGNHEFDQGWSDLRDRILGGDGDPDGNAAEWAYLGANVYDSTQLPSLVPLLPEYEIITLNGIRVAVIGAVTEETPALVSPAGMIGVHIGDPVEAVNRVAAELSDGVEAPGNDEADVLVATFHEGAPSGAQTFEQNYAASSVFRDIVDGVSSDVDVLLNGHTHQAYAWDAPVPGRPGVTRPVLQTGNYGEFVGKVVLTVDTTSKDVVASTRVNVPRSTANAAALAAEYPGVAEVQAIVDAALAHAAVIGNQPVGSVASDITTAYQNGTYGPDGYQAPRTDANRDQRHLESTLGDLVANSLRDTLADPDRGGAQIGVVNPGGLRSELFYPQSPLGEGDGVVTYAEANGVLPFVNNLWTTTLSGAQFKTMLEQQWQRDSTGNIPTRAYLQLGLSDNVTYTFDPTLPEGSRITSITIDGQPYDPAASYRIGTFSFLATGGDNFRIFNQATETRDSGLVDRDAWIQYLRDHPGLAPDFARQAVAVTPTPTTAAAGQPLTFSVSSLDLTSLGSPQNTTLAVSLGGVSLGDVAVVDGAATVDLVVPAGVPSGPQSLVLVASPSGTTVTLPVTVSVPGPAAPVIAVPAEGSLTNDRTPTISGTGPAGATVKVVEGATTLGTAIVKANGTWTLTSRSLAQGPHTITATAAKSGVTSPPSAAVTFTVDSVAPARPVITTPRQLTVVKDRNVVVAGTAEAGARLTVHVDGSTAGSTTVGAAGTWSLTTPPVHNGLHLVTARAADAAGNQSAVSIPTLILVCDARAPGGRTSLLWLLLCRGV